MQIQIVGPMGLERRRRACGLPIGFVANEVGVHRSTLSRIERGYTTSALPGTVEAIDLYLRLVTAAQRVARDRLRQGPVERDLE